MFIYCSGGSSGSNTVNDANETTTVCVCNSTILFTHTATHTQKK